MGKNQELKGDARVATLTHIALIAIALPYLIL